jgi:hypothetical protein
LFIFVPIASQNPSDTGGGQPWGGENRPQYGSLLLSHFYSSFWAQVFRCQCSGYAIASTLPDTLYETTPKWHGFLMIKLAALAAGGRTEQRIAEYRTAEYRGTKDGIASRNLF